MEKWRKRVFYRHASETRQNLDFLIFWDIFCPTHSLNLYRCTPPHFSTLENSIWNSWKIFGRNNKKSNKNNENLFIFYLPLEIISFSSISVSDFPYSIDSAYGGGGWGITLIGWNVGVDHTRSRDASWGSGVVKISKHCPYFITYAYYSIVISGNLRKHCNVLFYGQFAPFSSPNYIKTRVFVNEAHTNLDFKYKRTLIHIFADNNWSGKVKKRAHIIIYTVTIDRWCNITFVLHPSQYQKKFGIWGAYGTSPVKIAFQQN